MEPRTRGHVYVTSRPSLGRGQKHGASRPVAGLTARGWLGGGKCKFFSHLRRSYCQAATLCYCVIHAERANIESPS